MTAREFRKKHFPCSEDKTHLDLYSHTFEQKLNEFAKIKMIEIVESLKEYTHESHVILGHDARTAEEVVEMFLQQEPAAKVWYKSSQEETMSEDKYYIVEKSKGIPYGIRNDAGYILFFTKFEKYDNQEERYFKELQNLRMLSQTILSVLNEESEETK